jgi:hypothetical protein
VGGAIFLLYVGYVVAEAVAGRFVHWSISESCVKNALIGLFIYGLPACYVMIKGHLPWFGETDPEDDEDVNW